MARMTLDLRALDRDLDALAAGLALPPADGARGALPALADLDAALAALSTGMASTPVLARPARAIAPIAEPVAAASPPDEPAAVAHAEAFESEEVRAAEPIAPARETAEAPVASADSSEPSEAPVAELAAPLAEAEAAVVAPAAHPAPEESPAVDLAAQIAESLAGDVEAPSEAVVVDGGSDDDFYAALSATADAGAVSEAHPADEPPTLERAAPGAEAGPASEPPTLERDALPSPDMGFGDVDPTAFDAEESTSLVSFSSLAVFADHASPSAHAQAESEPPTASDAAASLSAESLFRDAVSASLLISNPLDFVAAANPAPAPAFDDASAGGGLESDDDDPGERVSVPSDLAALLEGELDPSEFGMPDVAVAAPLADEATRVEDGEFEMFVEEDELLAVAEVEEDAAPAPLPAAATSPSLPPPAPDTAALEGQEKKGFFKKIFGK
jgi:hypothetical protein